ncbi:MAG: DUF3768 domain-containing protein [Chloroflexi bacterium]|nr:DUF3768 domain-containing protein [Chloroflexota bacterium]
MSSDRPVISPRSAEIARLNDAFRRAGPQWDWVATANLVLHGSVFLALAFRKVMAFDAFTPDNDPYGEHDFGAITVDGVRMFWKIDYYDPSQPWGSSNPADPNVTRRVMTVMLPEDY